MNYGKAFIAGVIGGLVMGVIMMIAHSTGMTPMNMPIYQGSMITGETTPTSWMLGMFMHLMISGLIGIVYAAGFVYLAKRADWVVGAGFGVIHWLVAGVFFGMMGMMHSLMQTGELAKPGMFAVNFGLISIVAVLVLHVLYGAIVGAIYDQGLEVIDLDKRKIDLDDEPY